MRQVQGMEITPEMKSSLKKVLNYLNLVVVFHCLIFYSKEINFKFTYYKDYLNPFLARTITE